MNASALIPTIAVLGQMPRLAAVALLVFLFAIGGVVIWIALFRDRPRGRRRCPRCWYEMTYTPGRTCNECGHDAKQETELLRTRRKRWLAAAGVIGISCVAAASIDWIQSEGWATFLPAPVLTTTMRFDSLEGDASSELQRRIARQTLSRRQMVSLLRTCGKRLGPRPEDVNMWLARYGGLAEQLAVRLTTPPRAAANGPNEPPDPAFERTAQTARDLAWDIAQRIPPTINLGEIPPWTTGEPIPISFFVTEPWGQAVPLRVTVTMQHPTRTMPPAAFERRENSIQPQSFSMYVDPLEPGTHTVPISVVADRLAPDGTTWVRLPSVRTLKAIIETDDSDVVAMTPVDSAAIDAAVTRVFRGGLSQWESGPLPVRIQLNRRPTSTLQVTDPIAFGLEVTVLRNDVPVRTLHSWWASDSSTASAWDVPWSDDDALSRPTTESDVWEIAVRGTESLARRVSDLTHYWSGSVRFPVAVTPREGRSNSRGWISVAPPESVRPESK